MKNPLEEVVQTIKDNTDEGSAMILNQVNFEKVDVVPTGIKAIDDLTGIGGVPRGKITEIFGDTGTGKTTLCLHLIQQAHILGLQTGYVDSEHALVMDRIIGLGIDPSKFLLSQPNSGNQALDIMELMIRSKKLGLVICDSVAALTPNMELEKDMGDAPMAGHARLMSQAMRKLVAAISREKVAVVFTNQLRNKIGGFFPEMTTTGGNALKFYASLRLRIARSGSVQDKNGSKLAGKYKITAVKNRMSIPYRDTEFYINQKGIYTKES